jgi:hypothetical protein
MARNLTGPMSHVQRAHALTVGADEHVAQRECRAA